GAAVRVAGRPVGADGAPLARAG
ncbi:MAG: hypothetical protein AVDCRST_MAG18-4292, partial [uncultured Thermomicrobiales bacterium]